MIFLPIGMATQCGTGFRAPNIAESGSNGIHDGTPFYEIGRCVIESGKQLQLMLPLGYNDPNFSLEVNAFVNNINTISSRKNCEYQRGEIPAV